MLCKLLALIVMGATGGLSVVWMFARERDRAAQRNAR